MEMEPTSNLDVSRDTFARLSVEIVESNIVLVVTFESRILFVITAASAI